MTLMLRRFRIKAKSFQLCKLGISWRSIGEDGTNLREIVDWPLYSLKIMEQTFEPGSSPIQEVVIPFLIKEEVPSRDDENSSPEIPARQPDEIDVEHKQVSPNVEVNKKRGGRTRFTIYQRAELEAAFTASPYLSPHQRLALATRLRVKPVAVQSWFKNRRFKWRKEVREGSQNPQAALPTPPPGLAFMYQSPCVYGSGHIPVSPQCQGCCAGQPTSESYRYPDFTVYPYCSP